MFPFEVERGERSAYHAPGEGANMLYNITVHVDESDKEFLETPDSKLAMEQTIYRLIHSLKQMHFERQSRVQPLSRGYQGIQKT